MDPETELWLLKQALREVQDMLDDGNVRDEYDFDLAEEKKRIEDRLAKLENQTCK